MNKIKGISNEGIKRLAKNQKQSVDDSYDPYEVGQERSMNNSPEDFANFLSDIADKMGAIVSQIDQVFYNLSDEHDNKSSDPNEPARHKEKLLMNLITPIIETRNHIFESFDLIKDSASEAWQIVEGKEEV